MWELSIADVGTDLLPPLWVKSATYEKLVYRRKKSDFIIEVRIDIDLNRCQSMVIDILFTRRL